MKHVERHTFHIEFCKETLADNRLALFQELELFRKAWPNAHVIVCGSYVSIGYEGALAYRKAVDAAYQFRDTVKRHTWWKEIE